MAERRTVMSEHIKPCDLGGGEWDHRWKEHSDSSGECDGHRGDVWTWEECDECGITKDEFEKQNAAREGRREEEPENQK